MSLLQYDQKHLKTLLMFDVGDDQNSVIIQSLYFDVVIASAVSASAINLTVFSINNIAKTSTKQP